MAEDEPEGWRGIDALAALVGHYGWLEWRHLRADRGLGGSPGRGGRARGVVRRGGAPPRRPGHPLGRTPPRAGGGRRRRAGPGPVVPSWPPRLNASAASTMPGRRWASWCPPCCPGWERSTGPTWTRPRRCARPRWPRFWWNPAEMAVGETRSGRSVVRNLGVGAERAARVADLVTDFEQVFDKVCVFPAVPAILTAPLHCLRSRETPGTGASCLKRARTRPARSPRLGPFGRIEAPTWRRNESSATTKTSYASI